MAEPDHTVPARPSGPPTGPLARLSRLSPKPVATGESTQWDTHLAVARGEEVRRVIKLLLDDSDAFREVLSFGVWVHPPSWPLPAASYASLLVANHVLAPCVDNYRCHSNG